MSVISVELGDINVTSDGVGAPVLLLHSLGTSASMWAGVRAELRDTYELIVPDLLGHGESSPPVQEISIADHADAFGELMSELGHERFHVVGTSLGGLIALDLAARHPSRVQSLVLNGCPGWHLESQRMARHRSIAKRMVGPDGLVPEGSEGGGTIRELTPEARETRRRDLQRCGRWFLSSLWAVSAFDPISRLYAVTSPTLVLMGDGDFHLSTSYALSAGIAQSVHRVLPNAGHLTPLDDPDGVARELRTFLGSVS